jgi:hypothetical protein
MRRIKRAMIFFGILFFLIAWALFLHFYGPAAIIDWIGVEQGYLIAFFIAAFGGVSTLTATSYFATIITLAAAGLDPLLLGIFGGLGVTIGDSLFFFAGRHGRVVMPEKGERYLKRFQDWLKKRPSWLIPVIVYVYAGFSPFPNEFMTVSVGLTGTRYRRIILPLLLGNITITVILAELVRHGIRIFG